jgi:nickel-dependent lactate racemase
MKNNYYLYSGPENKEFFSLPKGWIPRHFVQPEESAEIIPPIGDMLFGELLHPNDGPPLKDLASRAQKIAIIVDDLTRLTPVAELLKILLPYLEENGCSRKNITVVIALGTHAPLSKKHLETKLGASILTTCAVVQHNAWQSDLVPVSIQNGERVVRINPAVAYADLRIGISSILPHPMAGFGGGPKILMPGVVDFESIREHHVTNVLHPLSRVGIIKGNPFHEEIIRTARGIGLQFSINCIYNTKGRIVRIIAGDLESSFSKAVELCVEKLGHRFEDKVDVTITSTFPHVHGNQLFKALIPSDMVTKENGAILLVAPLAEPIPAEFLNSLRQIREKSNNNPAEYIKSALSKRVAFLPDKPMDYNMALTNVFIRPKTRAILVSLSISQEEAAIMALEHAPSIEKGLTRLEKTYHCAHVAIFPSGGLIVPIIPL